jgi:hypothetical protein
MKRALIVANKWWEADPLVAALSSAQTAPAGVRFVPASGTPGLRGLVLGARDAIEVWCIQELLPARVSASSSEEKVKVLPGLLNAPDVASVVAFGTASTTSEDDNRNGSVMIGTNAFVHDPKSKNTQSHWTPPNPDVVLASLLPAKAFASLVGANDFIQQVQKRLLLVPNNPGSALAVFPDYDLVALSDVNITDYNDYKWADPAVVKAYSDSGNTKPMGSLETTHGVIRSCAEAPFLFISGITDRLGHFNEDVAPGQNLVASHNAGVAAAFIIPQLFDYLASS